MGDTYTILVICLVTLGLILALQKLGNIIKLVRKEKEIIDDDFANPKTHKKVVNLIIFLLLAPALVILIYILIKGF